MFYRLQKRLASSNIIEASEDGNKWQPFIAPLLNKEQGDKVADDLLTYLNKKYEKK